ncbi:ribonuclease H-like protein, partial [Lizonia empirigonia]
EEASETHTPLKFQIPEDVLRAAMTAPENTKASFWSSNLYRGSEGKQILVHYCKTKAVSERVARHFVNEKVVGFDIEWKQWASASSIKKNVSLIQLACENRIALFHIARFTETTAAQLMPPTLKSILESPDVYKVGVAVKGDFTRISKYLEVEPRGVFELSRLHNLVQFFATETKVTNKLVGLAAQVHQHLQLPLYKGGQLVDDPEDLSNVRSSDWSLDLNMQQIHYAAADAYAGFRLYDVLEEKRKQLKPTPPRPLVCDYDSKPAPKSSKSGKSRKSTTKADDATEPKQTQETEGYETAQEELIDSHQLEGEDLEASLESHEGSSESEDNLSIESVPQTKEERTVAGTGPSQKRVGRINLSRLKGPDPGHLILPSVPGGDEAYTSSDEDLVDLDASVMKTLEDRNVSVEVLKEEGESGSDEFEDSELEEALMELNVDGDGRLQKETSVATTSRLTAISEQTDHSPSPGLETSVATTSRLTAISEQTDHSPSPEPSPTPSYPPHSPEYNLATSWAQAYLASTIPSPTSLTPSHIRATIPHLRAYHMWRDQQLSLSEIARHLRDPPLSEATVGSYVLQAVVLERMEYDVEAVRGVLMGLPEALRRGKWRTLAEKVGA